MRDDGVDCGSGEAEEIQRLCQTPSNSRQPLTGSGHIAVKIEPYDRRV